MSDRARHCTQWAAQFAVAAELCKRGYDVALTMGSTTPDADLIVRSPTAALFQIDVKGQSGPNFWRIKQKIDRHNLFYVFALVPLDKPNRFFIVPQRDLSKLMNEYEHSGVKFDPRFAGVNWTTLYPYENQWKLLPQ